MPDLRSFRALRYSEAAGELQHLLAPPYDVIEDTEAQLLRSRSPYNAVRLVLPEGDPADRHRLAAERIAAWRDQGVLAEDDEPALYVYRQAFVADGRPVSRLALFAALELSPFEEGQVLPHEGTHAAPKRDRLGLTLATGAQLSPVFLVAKDDKHVLLDGLTAASAEPAIAAGTTPDGVEHEIWRVPEGSAARDLRAAGGARPLLIADGHHRYETALEVQRLLRDNVKSSYMLVCIVSAADPGLLIRPTHRALSSAPPRAGHDFDWLQAVGEAFETLPLEAVDEQGRGPSAPSMLMWRAPKPQAPAQAWQLVARPDLARQQGLTKAMARVPSVLFDRLTLRRLYGIGADQAADAGVLSYHRDVRDAVRAAGGEGAAFELPPVSLDDLWEMAATGGRLPPKSTYFQPKVPSGLLFRALCAGGPVVAGY